MPIERDDRPWGYFEVVDEGPGFLVKRICVRAGHRLSYQRHAGRSEHWFVLTGLGTALLDGVEHKLSAGDTLDIPLGTAHRVASVGFDDLVFVEIQTGPVIDEADIERLADDYGR